MVGSEKSKATKGQHTHSLYHEAVSRASKPQPIQIHTAPKSILMTAPNNIIFELFDTILKELTIGELRKFIQSDLKIYLNSNWSNKTLQNALIRLRRDQAVDRRAGSPLGGPNIHAFPKTGQQNNKKTSSETKSQRHDASETHNKESSINHSLDIEKSVDEIYQHIIWRIDSHNVTQVISLIIKFVIEDGYRRKRLQAQLYPDVEKNFVVWRSKLFIKLYSFGNLPANDQRLLWSNTDSGDLTQYIANYVDGSEKEQNPDLIRILGGALRDKTKNCILLTHNICYAIKALNAGGLRAVFIVDRFQRYKNLDDVMQHDKNVKDLIEKGKIYILESLDCVDFVPDPTSLECC